MIYSKDKYKEIPEIHKIIVEEIKMSEITEATGTRTVQEVIDKILLDMCGGIKFEQTCDIIAAGNPENQVTGVVEALALA